MTKFTITFFKDKKLTERGFGALIESDLGDTEVVIQRINDLGEFCWDLKDKIRSMIKKHSESEIFKKLEENSSKE